MAAESAVETSAIKAIKVDGPMVQLEPHDFTLLVHRIEAPLVVTARVRIFKIYHRYMTVYKGIFFYTRSTNQLRFAAPVELVTAKKIRTRF